MPCVTAFADDGKLVGDTDRTISGAEALAEMLSGYGVTHLFMVPAILRKTMRELERRTGISRIHAHGEKAAAYMADGYARTARRPAICAAQAIGALNLAAGLREAWLARSPVIAFTGGRTAATKFRGVYQEVDDVPSFDNVTKLNATVDDVSRFPDMVRQAFRIATTGSPGPVHLQFRGNEGQIDAESAPMRAVSDTRFAAVPAFRPAPDHMSVRRLVEQLGAAQRPVIVAGGGVGWSDAGRELVEFAELARVPVVTSLNGKDIIAASHPLAVGVAGTYSRPSANRVVARADLVCFLGTSAGGMTTHGWTLPGPGQTVVQVDIDPACLGRNYLSAALVNGDCRTSIRMMTDGLRSQQPADRDAWLAEVSAICTQWREASQTVLMSSASPIRPERICGELSAVAPADAIMVVDTGHAGMWMSSYFDLEHPAQRYLRSCGHLGWAFPAGLGAKCAAPQRPTLVFTGDAGLWYHLAEIETAVRWHINTITVVNNNGGGNQSKRGFDRAYEGQPTSKSRELWTYTDVDFARIAEGIGALGIRVDRAAQLRPALEQALECDRPVVIDVHTDIEVLAPPTVTS
jgi:acetolactate synthase-1/2/3 large subunit